MHRADAAHDPLDAVLQGGAQVTGSHVGSDEDVSGWNPRQALEFANQLSSAAKQERERLHVRDQGVREKLGGVNGALREAGDNRHTFDVGEALVNLGENVKSRGKVLGVVNEFPNVRLLINTGAKEKISQTCEKQL